MRLGLWDRSDGNRAVGSVGLGLRDRSYGIGAVGSMGLGLWDRSCGRRSCEIGALELGLWVTSVYLTAGDVVANFQSSRTGSRDNLSTILTTGRV